ncbi:putative glycosyl hydrolase family 71 [Lyophyllum shimeji]|uniref:Glycosyl hydrolase family 71 n=1 Tax=Lyophyllum shimeji TaxID=47721 RepID=A0A9P3Q0F7_LYOSH|nr:putative glycosyl hydrolase family 71 [Lyophyllum shimeji]
MNSARRRLFNVPPASHCILQSAPCCAEVSLLANFLYVTLAVRRRLSLSRRPSLRSLAYKKARTSVLRWHYPPCLTSSLLARIQNRKRAMQKAAKLLWLLACFPPLSSAAGYPRNIETSDAAKYHAATSSASHKNVTSASAMNINLEKRGGTKYVFMHHIVGSESGSRNCIVQGLIFSWRLRCTDTFPYTQADWADDLRQIQAKGVDALALNMGAQGWQRKQVASAYAAAAQLGANLKLFLSFDFTAMACDLNDLVGRVNDFAGHPNQFRVDGKVMVSSFSGDCLGNAGWASLKAQTNAYLMPFIWGLEGRFSEWSSLDSWYCWGCAWPSGNADKTTGDDEYYLSQLGPRYTTTVSPWMFTHYDYKNWYQRGDDWLLLARWEQLIAMRDRLTFVELVSWNDYGESHYMGPVKGAQPDGTTWTAGFPHTAWYDLCEYYITVFKTGSYPTITQDVIYYWARPHPAGATASSDGLGKPQGWDWTPDTLWAVVFAASPSTVTLTVGSSTQTFSDVPAGVTKLQIPLAPGQITVKMVRNGATVIEQTPADYTYGINPVTYNYNAYVGAARA